MLLVAATLLVLHLQAMARDGRPARRAGRASRPSAHGPPSCGSNLTAAEAKLTQLEALEKQLPQPDWQQILSRISQSMPDDVWLDRLTVHDGTSASLTGASYTDGGVYDFVGYLKQVPDIAEIALEGTGVGQSATGPTTNFTCSSHWQTLPVVARRRLAMIEQTLRRFCESKHRKLIVIAGTFVVGLVLVLPLVDVIRAGRDEKEALLASWILHEVSRLSWRRSRAGSPKSLPS